MARKIIAGTYTFVDAPEKLPQFTSATNILFDDNNGTVINYTTSPISGISTDKFVLAVDRPNEAQRYLVYAFEDTTAAGGALSVSKGWYWFNESSTSLDAISAPSVVFSDNCSINNELTTTEANALFTTSPIQVQPTVTTTRVLYKGKKELTMAQFEALTSLDDAVDYDITDFPNGGITNAQMTAALGYSRLFEDGEIYVCSDNGTYTKGNWYQIKVEGGVKSWEDITKGLKIYPVTDILNHDGIKSGTFTEEQMNNIKLADILQVYAIDGDPVYKYAYKGLIPTNPAQSTISANLYFAVSTEKGNYVLAINTDTRNWEVREPVSGDLQNYVPKQSEAEPVALTWRFNDTVDTNRDNDFLVNFTSNGINFTEMGFKWSLQQSPAPKDTMYYSGPTKFQDVYYGNWGATPDTNPYRTVTFETAPSGDLLAWLQANAVPQSEATAGSKVYAQITNENGSVSIRVFENEDADLQNLSITKDGVTINGKKPLTSVQPLYKHELEIAYSFLLPDSVEVNGPVMYHYLSNKGTQITNVSEIDDNFTLSGGIGKNSANNALTWTINEKPSVPDKMFSVKFTSNAIRYNNIGLSSTGDALPGISGVLIAYHREEDGMFDQVYEIYQGTERWSSQAYRTLTFETAPSGELLTWLQANAVPQGGADSTTVLLLNITVIKAGSSITVEAVNASTMGYITGTVGTITDTVTQLI